MTDKRRSASMSSEQSSILDAPSKCAFFALPDELVISIFALLDGVSLIRASRVCHRWHSAAHDRVLPLQQLTNMLTPSHQTPLYVVWWAVHNLVGIYWIECMPDWVLCAMGTYTGEPGRRDRWAFVNAAADVAAWPKWRPNRVSPARGIHSLARAAIRNDNADLIRYLIHRGFSPSAFLFPFSSIAIEVLCSLPCGLVTDADILTAFVASEPFIELVTNRFDMSPELRRDMIIYSLIRTKLRGATRTLIKHDITTLDEVREEAQKIISDPRTTDAGVRWTSAILENLVHFRG